VRRAIAADPKGFDEAVALGLGVESKEAFTLA